MVAWGSSVLVRGSALGGLRLEAWGKRVAGMVQRLSDGFSGGVAVVGDGVLCGSMWEYDP